jgi:hypothetical protein
MYTWYEKEIQLLGQPDGLLLSVRGSFDQNRVKIVVEVEHMEKDSKFSVVLYDKAGEAGRHTEDSLQARYLFRLQKCVDSVPKTYAVFRPWAVRANPGLEWFLPFVPPSTPSETPER